MKFPDVPLQAPRLTRGEIDALYHQMRNCGQYYLGQVGQSPLSIEQWRERELAKAGCPGGD